MRSRRALLPISETLRKRPHLLALLIAGLALAMDLVRQLLTGTLPIRILSVFLWEGTVLGLVIRLAGIGLSMVYDILNFPNFAHGEYLTFPAFGGWVSTFLIAGLGRFEVGARFLLGLASQGVNARAVGVSITATPVAVLGGALMAAAITVALPEAMLSFDEAGSFPHRMAAKKSEDVATVVGSEVDARRATRSDRTGA